VQIYCTTINTGPASNGLIPLTCNTAGAANTTGGGGGGTGSLPYTYTYGQAPTNASFLGTGGYDYTTSGFDAWTFGPAATSISLGQPGVPYVQGIGPNGTVPISGSLSGSVSTNASSTGTITTVSAATTSTTLHAADTSRVGVWIVNTSASATLDVCFASSCSTTTYTFALSPGAAFSSGAMNYTGIITGIWSAAVGGANFTEMTP